MGSPGALLASLIIGSIGFVLGAYGKKQKRIPQMTAGGLLLVFPYFVGDPVISSIIAAVICGACWLAVRLGL